MNVIRTVVRGVLVALGALAAGCATATDDAGQATDDASEIESAATRIDMVKMLANVAMEEDLRGNVQEDWGIYGSIGRVTGIRQSGVLKTLESAQVDGLEVGRSSVRARRVKQSVGVGNRLVTLGVDGSVNVLDEGVASRVLVRASKVDPVIQIDAAGHVVVWVTKSGAVSFLNGPVGTKPVVWIKSGATQVAAMGCGRVIGRVIGNPSGDAARRCAERTMLGYLNKDREFWIRKAHQTQSAKIADNVAEIAMAGQTLGVRKHGTNAFLTRSRNVELTPDETFEPWRTVVASGATKIRLGFGVYIREDGDWPRMPYRRADTGPFAGYTDKSGLWISKVGTMDSVAKIKKTKVTEDPISDFSLSYGITAYRLMKPFMLGTFSLGNLRLIKNEDGVQTGPAGYMGTGEDIRVSKLAASDGINSRAISHNHPTYLME
jgi:hypothetical protein